MDLDLDHEAYTPPHQLCSVCEPIVDFYSGNFDTLEVIEVPYGLPEHLLGPNSSFRKHHSSVSDMRYAATQGCHFCSRLANGLDSIPYETSDQQIYITYSKQRMIRYFVLWYLGAIGDPTSWVKASSVEFLRTDTEIDRRLIGSIRGHLSADPSPSLYASTGSLALRNLMADCLRQCIKSHNSCNEGLEGQMPSRLIDLNAFEGCQDLRLVSTLDKVAQAYAALSYCWGNRVITKLQRSNTNDFATRIPLRDLPKTVRETVEVCRGLCIRYLWVDALCIIQDDSKDFEHEVARMGSIYAGALVTIAATDSKHCDAGLYRPREPLMSATLELRSPRDLLAVCPSHEYCSGSHFATLGKTPLSKRAWAYQERVMSPRTIHFCERDIVWECREREACPQCTDRPVEAYRFKKMFTKLRQASVRSVANAETRDAWLNAVNHYSGTNLTYEDDRLSALAGIAQLVYQIPSYKASHGLWLPFFLDELLWYIIDTDDIKYRGVDRAEAPSWAWHKNGPNESFHTHSRSESPALYSCSFTTLPIPTPFGQLSSLQPSSFKVRGALHSCQVMVTKGHDTTKYSLKQTGHDELPVGAWSAPQGHSYPWKIYFHPDRDMTEQDVTCLTLRRTFSDFGTWCRSSDYGLVLTAVDSDKKIFRRIGYFKANVGIELQWTREEEEVEII